MRLGCGRDRDAAARAKAEALWADLPSSAAEDELLLRLVETFALVDPDAAKLVATVLASREAELSASHQAWLRDSGVPPLFAANLRLLYAQWLVHESLFDEAQEQLSGLTPDDVVAPASLLFYQGVVYHALLEQGVGIEVASTNCCKGRTPVRGATSRWPG